MNMDLNRNTQADSDVQSANLNGSTAAVKVLSLIHI